MDFGSTPRVRKLPDIGTEYEFADVRHVDGETTLALRRIEIIIASNFVTHQLYNLPHGFPQGQGTRRRNQPVSFTHEKSVTEAVAKFVQRIADRRLAHRKTLGSLRCLAAVQQRVQHHQQVEVKFPDIHISNIWYRILV